MWERTQHTLQASKLGFYMMAHHEVGRLHGGGGGGGGGGGEGGPRGHLKGHNDSNTQGQRIFSYHNYTSETLSLTMEKRERRGRGEGLGSSSLSTSPVVVSYL